MYKTLSFSKIRSWLYDRLADILSPAHCSYCKEFLQERSVFCETCYAKLKPVVNIMMPITATKSIRVFAAAAYQEPIRTLIMAKSWSDSVASVHLGELIWQRTDLRTIPCDYLIPVPLHWTRFAKRGFNQAFEVSKVLAKKRGAHVANILKRSKRTPFQSGLTCAQRITNVHDAFSLISLDASLYKDKHLVIVDDLLTTGSTARAIAQLLFTLKPASVSVIVASRVIG